jgi:hypothetical protein
MPLDSVPVASLNLDFAQLDGFNGFDFSADSIFSECYMPPADLQQSPASIQDCMSFGTAAADQASSFADASLASVSSVLASGLHILPDAGALARGGPRLCMRSSSTCVMNSSRTRVMRSSDTRVTRSSSTCTRFCAVCWAGHAAQLWTVGADGCTSPRCCLAWKRRRSMHASPREPLMLTVRACTWWVGAAPCQQH